LWLSKKLYRFSTSARAEMTGGVVPPQKSFPANEKALSGRESLSLICAKPAGAHSRFSPIDISLAREQYSRVSLKRFTPEGLCRFALRSPLSGVR
jgi:hypothetical protein